MNPDPNEQQKLIIDLTNAILTEILDQVISEYERAVGTDIGAVHIGPADGKTGRRKAEIEIRPTGGERLDGLIQYRKLLCEHEGLNSTDMCRRGDNR